jgi:hypothetical protein
MVVKRSSPWTLSTASINVLQSSGTRIEFAGSAVGAAVEETGEGAFVPPTADDDEEAANSWREVAHTFSVSTVGTTLLLSLSTTFFNVLHSSGTRAEFTGSAVGAAVFCSSPHPNFMLHATHTSTWHPSEHDHMFGSCSIVLMLLQ